jgi:hypothetical protein
MSFGEFMFLAGFTQKTAKEYLNIKRDRGIILWILRRHILEDTRRHHTEAGHETLPGGAARPAMVGNAHELPKSSPTAS